MMEEDVFGPAKAMEDCTDEAEALRVCLFVFFLLLFWYFLTFDVYLSVAASTNCNRSK